MENLTADELKTLNILLQKVGKEEIEGEKENVQKAESEKVEDKKSDTFRDTTDNQEHDAKNRLLIPGPSSDKPVAEIHQLKINQPK